MSFEAPSGFVQQFRHLRYLPGQKQLQLVRLFTTVVVVQGYSYDQRLEYVDIDFNVPHTPIVGLGQ